MNYELNEAQWRIYASMNYDSTGSDNGLSPGRPQTIIWTNTGLLSIGTIGTNYSEIMIVIHTFSFKKMRVKISSAKWRPVCLGLKSVKDEEFIMTRIYNYH